MNTSIKTIFLTLCTLGLSACISTSGKHQAENYSLIKLSENLLDSIRTIPFDKLSVSSAMEVHLLRSDTPHIELRCSNEELSQSFDAHIEGGELKLSMRKEKLSIFALNKDNQKALVYISMPKLSGINAGGACDVLVKSDLAGKSLDISLSGSSDLLLPQSVQYRTVKCRLSGASDLKATHLLVDTLTLLGEGASDAEVKGKCLKLISILQGASDADLDELETDTASVELQGASSMELLVNKLLSYKVNGASELNYRGQAGLGTTSLQGASRVSKH